MTWQAAGTLGRASATATSSPGRSGAIVGVGALFTGGLLGLLGVGVACCGGAYSPPYRPLLVGVALLAAIALGVRVPGRSSASVRRLAFALLPVALAILVQLIPLSSSALARLSPSSDALLRNQNVTYFAVVSRTIAGTADPASPPDAAVFRHPLSVRPESTWRGLAYVVCFGLLFLGTVRMLTWVSPVPLVGGILVLGVVVALGGLGHQAMQAHDVYWFWPASEVGWAFGPFLNRNHFAGWMVMALPLSLGYVIGRAAESMPRAESEWRRRVLWLSSPEAMRVLLGSVGILVMAVALVATMSRSGMTALASALALFGWLAARRQASRIRQAVVLGVVCLVLIVSITSVGVDAVDRRFAQASWSDVGGRLEAWQDGARIVRDFPVFGTGFNTFGTAILHYRSDPTRFFREAHNEYVQLAAEGGLLIGIPLLLAGTVLVREIARRFAEGGDSTLIYWIRAGATLALVAIALQAVVEFSMRRPANAALFAAAAAIAVHRRANAGSVRLVRQQRFGRARQSAATGHPLRAAR